MSSGVVTAMATASLEAKVAAAARYAGLGLATVPVLPGDKRPAIPWRDIAGPDPEPTVDYLSDHPDANIGILTGSPSGGLLVVDVDVHVDGVDGRKSMRDFDTRFGRKPRTVAVRTGHDGIQEYFLCPRGSVPRNATNPDLGIDLRGEGGIVVAPPSVLSDGGTYRFVEGRSPDDLPIAEADERVMRLVELVSRRGPSAPRRGGVPAGPFVAPGGRNDALFRYGAHVRARGGTEEDVALAVMGYNDRLCRPPLGEREVLSVISSVCSYERGEDLSALAAGLLVPGEGVTTREP